MNIKTAIKLLMKDKRHFRYAISLRFGKSTISRLLSDRLYLRFQYRGFTGNKLNINNPVTFNDKINWLKLNDRNPEHIKLVDKYEVKGIVAAQIGHGHIIPTLGVWDSFDEIDFSKLPNQFVLKCTHDSGSVIVCKEKEKLDIESARKKLEHGLNTPIFYWGREWPYKNLKPRIIAEVYLEDEALHELRDYKFFCFNGKVRCFKIDFDRFTNHHANYYDINGKLLPFGEYVCMPDFSRELDMPTNLKKMIDYAEILSNKEAFVRVDFYEVQGKVYFGEMTFFPAAGFGPFVPDEWDKELGSWIDLDSIKGKRRL